MAFQDIERLKARVEKDPNSMLFVPLAEEYKKVGMFDEAITVLTKGLERHPNYMSARVSLGKIYLEKGMFSEASFEFEQVMKTIPDNLYANKKLAEIYRDLGEKEKAIEAYKRVLRLNPKDEDSAKGLADLQGKEKEFTIHPEVTQIVRAMLKEEGAPELTVSREIKVGKPLTVERGVKEEVLEAKEPPEAEVVPEGLFKESTGTIEEVSKPVFSMNDADSSIAEGRYEEALNIYKQILSREPENRHVLQRIEELKALLKLLGKGKEELSEKLDRFLQAIKDRQDEFFRNS